MTDSWKLDLEIAATFIRAICTDQPRLTCSLREIADRLDALNAKAALATDNQKNAPEKPPQGRDYSDPIVSFDRKPRRRRRRSVNSGSGERSLVA